MFATARLQGGDAGAALVVPAAAVQALEGDTVLLAASPRGAGLHVRALPVRIGRRTAERAEVLSGVEAGTRVVVDGAAIVKAEILRRREAGSEEP
jgi:cobalt-zinc-cadmium efflux system membrane fusion protein